MALIKCPECGKDVSDRAAVCINCGYPLSNISSAQQSHTMKEKAFKVDNPSSSSEQLRLRKEKEEAERLERERKEEVKRQERERKAEIRKKRTKKITIITAPILCVIIAFAIVFITVINPAIKYNKAIEDCEAGNYLAAIPVFQELGADYKHSAAWMLESAYGHTQSLCDAGKQKEANEFVDSLYSDSADSANYIFYRIAVNAEGNKNYTLAYELFTDLNRKNYSDSFSHLKDCSVEYARVLIAEGNHKSAYDILNTNTIKNHKDASTLIDECKKELAQEALNNKYYSEAFDYYTSIKSYKTTDELYRKIVYEWAKSMTSSYKTITNTADGFKEYYNMILRLDKMLDYKDAKDIKHKLMLKYGAAAEDSTDSSVRKQAQTYLKELISIGYENAQKTYDQTFAWKAEIVANNDENNKTTNMTSISKYNKWYFHIKLSGGEPGATVNLKVAGFFPDGSTHYGSWNFKWKDGTSSWYRFWYNYPGSSPGGTFTMKLYDSSWKLIAEKSVKITN